MIEKYKHLKKVSYYLPYKTVKDIENAEALQSELYELYNIVNVYPQGSCAIIIEASDEI